MQKKTVKIGLCGVGTVGSGTFNLLAENAELIAERTGAPIEVVHVGARRDNAACDTSSVRVSRDIFEVASDPDVDILVELIGGTTTARELVETALRSGKHVVTANKALIAEHGNDIFALAAEQGVSVCYEAAVAGGIPIIKALREGLAANRIDLLAGIINGTGNFILTEMGDKGRTFWDALTDAQALGFAEADPTFDVEGIDAAHKLVILAAIAFGTRLQFNGVYTEGITTLTPEDLEYARELGYRVKHLGIARQSEAGMELRVHPTLVPEAQLLADVDGEQNAIMVEGNAVGPTLYYGAGAGAGPTASAVVSDLIDLARDICVGQSPRIEPLGVAIDDLEPLPVVPIGEVVTPWYLRMEAEDRPGVMADVTRLLGDQGISIEALIQKAPREGEIRVPVVILTHKAANASLEEAVRAIEALDSISGKITGIRVETFE